MVNVSTIILIILVILALLLIFFAPLTLLWRLVLGLGVIVLAGLAWAALSRWANQATAATRNLVNPQGMMNGAMFNNGVRGGLINGNGVGQPVVVGQHRY